MLRHILAAILLLTIQLRADTVAGKVVSVADGDTLTVLDSSNTQHKIRLKGIDAPEKGQPYGKAAKQHLSGLVFGKNVSVVTSGKPDKYGRDIGKIYVGAQDINAEMVSAGYAWAYLDPDYGVQMQQAAAARRGLWADPHPEEPSVYRKRRGIGYSKASPPATSTTMSVAPPVARSGSRGALKAGIIALALFLGLCGIILVVVRLSR